MSLQKKYYYTFRGLDNTSFLAEIWQETTATITAEEITGDLDPFNIEYPTTTIFEPVKGSGCTLNLLSTIDRKFLNLYTANMLEYQIRLYKSGILYWVGYLDSELYSEPFNELTNYTVTFTGSDGFALLERLNYVDGSGNKFTGLVTQWQVLQNILSKLNLPFKNIYIGLSTLSNDFTLAASETILHKTYCNNQNWYNEDGDAETARKVLEEILKPYAAYIIQDNANIYITDVNTMAGATDALFRKYSSSFSYISTDTINLNLGDLSTIKFAANDQQLNVVSGFNRQIIKYSPYITPELIDFKSTDFTTPVQSTTYGTSPYQWSETIYSNSGSWINSYGFFASYTGAETLNKDDADSYLKLSNSEGNLSFTYKNELPYLIPSNSKLKITCKAFCRMSNNLNGDDTTSKIYQLKVKCRLKIGDKQYFRTSAFSKGWVSSGDSRTLDFDFEQQEVVTKQSKYLYAEKAPIDNKWIDLKALSTNGGGGIVNKNIPIELISNDYYIPLNSGFSGGLISFEIYDWDILTAYDALQAQTHDEVKALVKDVRIKDLVISIIDSNNKEYSKSDLEYTGYMNQQYKNEGSEITLYQGTSKIDTPIEKGSLMGYNGNFYYLNTWTREGKTNCIEKLLLRSIVSNYTNKRIELSATINRIDSIVGCLKYQSFLPDKNLMIVGNTQNLADNTTTVTLQEVIKDNLEINESQ